MLTLEENKIINRLLKLPACALLTTGRTGTDFLQSLLDSHPEVLTFNGHLFFHTFWNNSKCIAAGKFELEDLIDEFLGKHIEKLKSKYDILDGKNRLGDNYNQSLNIGLNRFKSEVINLLKEEKEINSRNFMVAVYGAYAVCLGQDLKQKRILFHHAHHFEEFEKYLKDFPDSKVICMTRDPRANFVSGIEHWRKFNPATDQGAHLYFYLKRILADASVLEKYQNKYVVIRLEDLGDKKNLDRLCNWLGIAYDDCLMKTTWGGLAWHGDNLSKENKTTGWSSDILKNNWEQKLSFPDRYSLNYIMFYRLKYYRYGHKEISLFSSIIMPFFILLPLSYELRFYSPKYILNCFLTRDFAKIIKNILYYLRRIRLFMRYYLLTLTKKKFLQPILLSDSNGQA